MHLTVLKLGFLTFLLPVLMKLMQWMVATTLSHNALPFYKEIAANDGSNGSKLDKLLDVKSGNHINTDGTIDATLKYP